MIEPSNRRWFSELIASVITEELAIEDRLNDEFGTSSASTASTCAGRVSYRRCSGASRTR